MNTPNPLLPHGSPLEQKSNARSRVKLAVFFVLAIHVVGVMALLVQGCKPEQQTDDYAQPLPPPEIPPFEAQPPPAVDTNNVLLAPVAGTNPTTDAGYQPYQPAVTPLPVEPAVAPPPTLGQEYVIQKGDTYYSIGKEFGVSMQAIADANPGVDPNRLQIGKTITIPPPQPTRETTAPAMGAPEQRIYTVKSGDTLTRIAQQYGTTVRAIRDANNLPTTVIRVGQKLKIPAPEGAAGGNANGGM